jgi:ribose transport system ATP-binding protein
MNDIERSFFFDILSLVREKAEAIFYISHRLDEVTKVGNKLSIMERGKIISTSEIENMDERDIIHLITGNPMFQQYPKIKVKKNKKCVLNVKNLSSKKRLKEVSFKVYKQEILGITGLVNSNRTHLANCLFGVKQPDYGTISINGKIHRFTHPFDALLAGISLIPEDRHNNSIFDPLTMGSNMTLPNLKRFLNNSMLDDNILTEVALSYVKKLGITPNTPGDSINFFSGGNQQKVLLARWFMKRSAIYIMDEPTRGIDTASKIDIYNSMNNLIIKGASVILLSSDIDEIIGMCDRILILSDGKITAELSQSEASKEKIYSLAVKG